MTGKGGKFAAVALLWVGVLLLAAAAASAHGGRGGDGCEGAGVPGMYSGKMLDRLGTTARQNEQIREIIGRYRPETEPAIRQLVAERRALRKMVQGGAVDEAAIRGQAGKVASLESDLALARARAAREVRALLTAEQLARLEELQARRERKADRMMERWSPGGEGGKR